MEPDAKSEGSNQEEKEASIEERKGPSLIRPELQLNPFETQESTWGTFFSDYDINNRTPKGYEETDTQPNSKKLKPLKTL